jgi:hypothetical protein
MKIQEYLKNYRGYTVHPYVGYSQERINEQARFCDMSFEEKQTYLAALRGGNIILF